MSKNPNFKPFLIRLLIVLAISVIFVGLFNEASYLLQKDKYDRAPEKITLTIPAGTAEKVDAGEDVLSIPDQMVFVVGDTLIVQNNDRVSHQLGPIWVPPNSTGSLIMEQVDKLAYSCSFQTSRYLGLDVRAPTTLTTRLTGLLLATPTLTTLLFIYSLVVFPLNKKTDKTNITAVQT